MNKVVAVVIFSILATPALGLDRSADELEQKWKSFQSEPRKFMQRVPAKLDTNGLPIPPNQDSRFSSGEVRRRDYVSAKTRWRRERLGVKPRPLGFAGVTSKIDGLFDRKELAAKNIEIELDLREMERRGLLASNLTELPWSGSYWPLSMGGLGARYASESFLNAGTKWKSYYDYVMNKETAREIFQSGDQKRIDELSPAEKYDLLIWDGRSEYAGLAARSWEDTERYANSNGRIESWMGLCHGWAPAAFSAPRPSRSIAAVGGDGKTSLRFFPADTKGLVTFLWATQEVPTTFVGTRCNDKRPATDPETGRVMNATCFDVNPALWHVSVVNQIGQAKRSFVMDATYDYQVWNQPVTSYSYTYFNPQTGEVAKTVDDARVERAEFTNDKFKKFRGTSAASFVGIHMSVTYAVENMATHEENETDETRTVSYMYDLELDRNGRIIGGEWYQNTHPDFLWLPKFEQKPQLPGDQTVLSSGAWTPAKPLPEFWKRIAVMTARSSGDPLPAIIDAIGEAAK